LSAAFCAKISYVDSRKRAQPRRNSKAVSGVSGACFGQLFHEAIGAVFAVLALGWLNAALRAWTRDVARWLIGLAVAVALLFVFFRRYFVSQARKL